jgi:ABC-type dipeptide/oligopeptide/nickel transport system permease subunit
MRRTLGLAPWRLLFVPLWTATRALPALLRAAGLAIALPALLAAALLFLGLGLRSLLLLPARLLRLLRSWLLAGLR